jgi:hypothetical protein
MGSVGEAHFSNGAHPLDERQGSSDSRVSLQDDNKGEAVRELELEPAQQIKYAVFVAEVKS